MNLLRNAVQASSDDDGWAGLAAVGHIITKQQPDFDARSYGYTKLSDLIAATTLFELDRRSFGDGKPTVVYARDKRYQSKNPQLALATQPSRPGANSVLNPPGASADESE
ncbi:OST-HTH/LOTUS domain-containing protein [Nonomuraea endophytica]|uniref:OST-HTH/LOTUS domain-containing protein n=1 Tax=Nonomuraea endophytica TaxID=714136 RepID=UPI0037C8A955